MAKFYAVRNSLFIISIQILFAALTWNSVLYIGDDETAIVKAEATDLGKLMWFHFRFFEIVATKISYYYLDKAWLYISFLFFGATLFISAKIAREIFADIKEINPFQVMILCSTSPFLAQSLSQIDTVSQVSGTFFAVTTFYFSIKLEQGKYDNLVISLCSIFALASKELFLLMPLFASFVVVRKSIINRKITLSDQAIFLMLIASVLLYLHIRNTYGGMGSLENLNTQHRYGIKSDSSSLAQNFLFTIGSIFNLVPTSLIGLAYGKFAYVFCAFLFSMPLVIVAIKHVFYNAKMISWYYILWIVCIAAPLILIKSAELYVYPLYFMLVLPLISRFGYQTIYVVLPLLLCSLLNIYLLKSFRHDIIKDENQMTATYITSLFREANYSLYTFYPKDWYLGENLLEAHVNVIKAFNN